jgi:outer membrane protein OmpA-like peptidoglycan-associated protein
MFTRAALPGHWNSHHNLASEGNAVRGFTRILATCVFLAVVVGSAQISFAQDVAGSKDPAGMKRYEGSTLIGYRAPKFDEYLLPLGEPTQGDPPAYEKSMPAEGQVSYYTYLAPAGRSPAELYRNYKQEFQRLGIEVVYEKSASQHGWFGPTFDKISSEIDLGQILEYDEADERLLVGKTSVGKTKDAKPTYYEIFVTAYKDGVIPERLADKVAKTQALAQIVVVAPDVMEKKMTFVNADDMQQAIHDSGKVALYGLYFDIDKDAVKSESQPTLAEIAKLMKTEPALRLHVVGHTDNQGKPDYNLDLSRRRAASVVAELTSKYGIAASRLDAFGCGVYSPVASNEAEAGRGKNRRVELVQW